jgi:hypothetical protein
MNNLINLHFRCAITLVRPTLPMNCPCGHLFESTAIYHWLQHHNTCPVSRLPLSATDLRFNSTVHQFLLDLGTSDEDYINQSTQTSSTIVTSGDDSVEIDHVAEVPPLIKPFVSCSNVELGAAELGQVERDYLGPDLLVDLGLNTYNPESANLRLEPVVDHLNRNFINHLIPQACDHPHIVIRKYAYQHNSDSLVVVAKHLARAGYYVYDLFRVSVTNGLHRYVLYSCDVKDDSSPVMLSRYVRSSPRPN